MTYPSLHLSLQIDIYLHRELVCRSSMASKMFFSVLVALPLLSLTVSPDLLSVEASTKEGHVSHFRPSKLFVFGDSYADTGNGAISKWKVPYGITFPGKPVGRFSDGRVFTDFLGQYVEIPQPFSDPLYSYICTYLHGFM